MSVTVPTPAEVRRRGCYWSTKTRAAWPGPLGSGRKAPVTLEVEDVNRHRLWCHRAPTWIFPTTIRCDHVLVTVDPSATTLQLRGPSNVLMLWLMSVVFLLFTYYAEYKMLNKKHAMHHSTNQNVSPSPHPVAVLQHLFLN